MVLVSLFVRPIVRSISYFFGLAKKNCPVSETWQFFVHPFEFFVQSFLKIGHSLISRLEKKWREWTKYELSSLWDRTIFFLAEQKNRNWPDNWSAKRLTKTTWTSLDGSIFVSQTKKKITWLVAQDWPKPHGRPYYLNSRDLTFSSKFCQIYSSRHSGLFFVEKMVVCYFPILGLQYIDQFIHQF